MAFFALSVLMAIYLDPALKPHKVKPSCFTDYHKQFAAIRAFDVFLPFGFFLLLPTGFAIGNSRPKFRSKIVYLNDIENFFMIYEFQVNASPCLMNILYGACTNESFKLTLTSCAVVPRTAKDNHANFVVMNFDFSTFLQISD